MTVNNGSSTFRKYTMYGGDVFMLFSPGFHRYKVNGTPTVGVTSVLSTLAKPALIPWAVNETIGYLKENLRPGVAYDEIQIKDMLDEAKKAHRTKKEKAGDFGTIVHAWLEDYIKGKNPETPVNPEIKQATEAFVSWVLKNKVKFTSSEKVVYSRRYNYAGTCDFTCEIDGKRYVGDIKTSKAIYNEYLLQVSAYRYALQEEMPDVTYDGMLIIRVPKDEKDSIEIKHFNDYQDNARAFIRLLEVYNQLQKLTNIINKKDDGQEKLL